MQLVEAMWTSGLGETLGDLLRQASDDLSSAPDLCVMLSQCSTAAQASTLLRLRQPIIMLRIALLLLEKEGNATLSRAADRVLAAISRIVALAPKSFMPVLLNDAALLQALLSDRLETSRLALVLLADLLQRFPAAIQQLDRTRLLEIVDELVFKLTQQQDSHIAGLALTSVHALLASGPPEVLQHLMNYYEQLPAMLRHMWGRGPLAATLAQVGQFFETQQANSFHDRCLQQQHQAAARIQAAWRGRQTRRFLQQQVGSILVIQRWFRRFQARRQTQQSQHTQALQARLDSARLERQARIRQKLEMREILENTPASRVQAVAHEYKARSAVVIQRLWRGYQARQATCAWRHARRQTQAAITIQRSYRQCWQRRQTFLKQQTGENTELDLKTADMDGALRDRLQRQINQAVALAHKDYPTAEAGLLEQQARKQLLEYNQYYHRVDFERHQRLEALIAHLSQQTIELREALCLPSDTNVRLHRLSANVSQAVARVAQARHKATMCGHTQSWWLGLQQTNASAPNVVTLLYPNLS